MIIICGLRENTMYEYVDISTNNLKNISVKFKDHEIVYIGGASGSGKSSLAFGTILAISESEYGSIVCDNKVNTDYKIGHYDKVLVAAGLRQLNFNVNPRSTILSYFDLNSSFIQVVTYFSGLAGEMFSQNGSCRCKTCNGIGTVRLLDELLLVDEGVRIEDVPFKCWKGSYVEYYRLLLLAFCQDMGISEKKTVGELNQNERNLLLRGKSGVKYKIKFYIGGRKRVRTEEYKGPLWGTEKEHAEQLGTTYRKYLRSHICPSCHGCRLEDSVSSQVLAQDINVKRLLINRFDEVEEILKRFLQMKVPNPIKASCQNLIKFTSACRNLNIAHLNFSRAICSLSGGELQRLRLAQLMKGRLHNLLLVLDEPTASLSMSEVDLVVAAIQALKKDHTVIVVDHCKKMQDIADRCYFLGPRGGVHGGRLVVEEDVENVGSICTIKKHLVDQPYKIYLKSDYVDFGDDLTIYKDSVNCLIGVSGVGKSTILRDILPFQLEGYEYITQKPIKASRRSNLATFMDVLGDVRLYFAKHTGRCADDFSLLKKGACRNCNGKGVLEVADLYDEKLSIACEKCGGTGYAKVVSSYLVEGFDIYHFLDQNIEDIEADIPNVSLRFTRTIKMLCRLGLGHLSLNRKVCSLSGGENQRLKLAFALCKNNTNVLGLDEPAKGLGPREIIALFDVINEQACKGKTFIVAEHNPTFINLCPKVTRLVRQEGRVFLLDVDKIN